MTLPLQVINSIIPKKKSSSQNARSVEEIAGAAENLNTKLNQFE